MPGNMVLCSLFAVCNPSHPTLLRNRHEQRRPHRRRGRRGPGLRRPPRLGAGHDPRLPVRRGWRRAGRVGPRHRQRAWGRGRGGGRLGGGVGFLVTLLTAERKFAKLRGEEIDFDLVRKSKSDPGKDNGNAWWYAYTGSAIVCTLAAVFGAFYPAELDVSALLAAPLGSHAVLAAWLAVANVAAFLLFLADRGGGDERLRPVDALMFVVAVLGGSLGFMLAMGFLGTKHSVLHYGGGMPLLLATNAVCATTLLLTGIA